VIPGRLLAIVTKLISEFYTHTTLDNYFLKLDLQPYARHGGSNKLNKVGNVIGAIKEELDDEDADKLILKMIKELVAEWHDRMNYLLSNHEDKDIKDFYDALRIAGWSVSSGELIPTTPGILALDKEITGFELDLAALQLSVALEHYKQAIDNYSRKQYEASNGQLRSFLENMYIELCKLKTSEDFEDPLAALQHLLKTKKIDGGEYDIARGILKSSNERGAHHGLSDEQEALFRLHISTALGRYLVARLK